MSCKAITSLALGVLFFFACYSGVPAILIGFLALGDIEISDGRLRGRRVAIAGIVLGVVGCVFTFFLPFESREVARRAQCINNLKQIGLAMHSYNEAYGSFPAAAITDKNGRPLLSWRVTILPFLEANELYAKFHLDEPWDSPHNLSLLGESRGIYACPSDHSLNHTMTGYLAVVGNNTAFTPDFRPLTIQDFTDDLSQTILVGESNLRVPWTKPEDLPFDMNVPFSDVGSHHDSSFNVVFADAKVKSLKTSIPQSILKALLTRNGGEVISRDSY